MIVLKQNYRLQDLLINQAIKVEDDGDKIKSYAILCRAIEANKVLARSKNKIQKKGVCAETVADLEKDFSNLIDLHLVSIDEYINNWKSMNINRRLKKKQIRAKIKSWNTKDEDE